jgi:hypothetical protein
VMSQVLGRGESRPWPTNWPVPSLGALLRSRRQWASESSPQRWVEYLNTKRFSTSCVTTSPYTLSVVRISECRMSFCCTGNRSSRGLQLATAPSQSQRLYPASSARTGPRERDTHQRSTTLRSERNGGRTLPLAGYLQASAWRSIEVSLPIPRAHAS